MVMEALKVQEDKEAIIILMEDLKMKAALVETEIFKVMEIKVEKIKVLLQKLI